MEDKKTTVRLTDDEIQNLKILKEILFNNSGTDNGIIKYIINNFLQVSTDLKVKNLEVSELKRKNNELKNKINIFTQALKNLTM